MRHVSSFLNAASCSVSWRRNAACAAFGTDLRLQGNPYSDRKCRQGVGPAESVKERVGRRNRQNLTRYPLSRRPLRVGFTMSRSRLSVMGQGQVSHSYDCLLNAKHSDCDFLSRLAVLSTHKVVNFSSWRIDGKIVLPRCRQAPLATVHAPTERFPSN